MLRVGLIGLGDAGRHHARALSALDASGALAWTAVCARDSARVEQFRVEHAVPPRAGSFTDLDSLLAARACDAVVLATPDGFHASQIERCAAQGVHVLVEKPLALSHAEGQAALVKCGAAQVALGVGYHLRHHQGHKLVHARRAELLGVLRHVDVRWSWPDPATSGWRARGEGARFWSLAALGTHAIDLARWMADAPVERVVSLLEPPDGADRSAEVSLRFTNGVLAHISVSITHRALSRLLLTGDQGEVECRGTLGARGDGEIAVRPLREAARPLPFEVACPYEAQLRDFAKRVAAGRLVDDTLSQAVENLAVLERIGGGSPR